MLIRFNKEQIAALLKNQAVQAGIEKGSKGIKLSEMDSTNGVLEYIGAAIISKMVDGE